MSRAKDNTNAVYANYRSALKASHAPRSGARKQDALTVTADRYKMPISEVKAIVRAADEAAGVTHSHTENYLRELAFAERAAKAQNTLPQDQIDAVGHMFCVKCRTTDENLLIEVRPDMDVLEKNKNLSFSIQCYPCYSAGLHRFERTVYGLPTLADAVHANWDYPQK